MKKYQLTNIESIQSVFSAVTPYRVSFAAFLYRIAFYKKNSKNTKIFIFLQKIIRNMEELIKLIKKTHVRTWYRTRDLLCVRQM